MSVTTLERGRAVAAPDWRRHWIGRSFAIDLRSLALFRIAIGAVILLDLVRRSTFLEAFYADTGIVPRSLLAELRGSPILSIHALSGSVAWQAALLGGAAIAAVCVILGYRTRLAVLLSWLLLLSLHTRNPYILNAGDQYVLNLLLWSTLLPLGARFSLDARRRPLVGFDRILSVATAGILLQVAGLYLISVLYKTGEPWGAELTAVYYAVNLEGYATSVGQWLTTWPMPVLRLLTAGTLAIEIAGPLLALSPFRAPLCRTLAAILFIGFHLSMGSAMELGIFTGVTCAGWLLFLPGELWDRLRNRISGLDARRQESSLHDIAVPDRRSRPSTLVATALLLAALVATISGVGEQYEPVHALGAPMRALRFTQRWNMFSPQPATRGTWYALTGYTESGEAVNVLDPGADPVLAAPKVAAATYPNARWRKFLFNWYPTEAWEPHRTALPAYLWRRWQNSHPERPLDHIEVRQFIARTMPPGRPKEESDTVLVVYRVDR